MTEANDMKVVIVGGGVAAIETALALRAEIGDRVRLTMVTAEADFVARPHLVGEPFAEGRAPRIHLAAFARDMGAELLHETVVGAHVAERQVETASGERIDFGALVVAAGARPARVYPRALTFLMEEDPEALNGLLRDIDEHYSRRIAFVVPPGVAWSMPIYELALMTAAEAHGMGIDDADIRLITPEERPLGLFGQAASEDVAGLLARARIRLHTSSSAEQLDDGTLVLRPAGERLARFRVVALPRLLGPSLHGLPSDGDGFIPVDQYGRVRGLEDVYAAGDVTTWPVKQGGLATQQADVVAATIAHGIDPTIELEPYRPVLRGVLLTGAEKHYVRSTVGGVGLASDRLMWWPPSKIAGKFLAPYLKGWMGETLAELPAHASSIPIDLELPASTEPGFGFLRSDSAVPAG